ncbi:MAG: tetratricopeptide repeat protein [Proteiniphilum sp.]|jgi:hypothetical protein|nr:tetratricopeptide repeat protein [Proteiniphilum sp.]
MQKEDLYGWMENPDRLDASSLEKLRGIVEEYPCFNTARLLYTKNLNVTGCREYEDELGKTAVLCNDRRKLFYLICREEYEMLLSKNERLRSNGGDRTEELLESFLSSLDEGAVTAPVVENAELNLASTDYLSYLKLLGEGAGNSVQDEHQKLQHQDIIDAFIEKAESEILFVAPSGQIPLPDAQQETEDEGGEFLTETLAKIYIKQEKYEQALAIIKRLSLNFPKKSVYFAHQIRFLELLIINEKNK